MIYYQEELKKIIFLRKGNCMDNGLMENFFSIMKREMFYGYEKTFKSLDSLKFAMEEYLLYYNKYHINKKRKGLSPIDYRKQYFSLINKLFYLV